MIKGLALSIMKGKVSFFTVVEWLPKVRLTISARGMKLSSKLDGMIDQEKSGQRMSQCYKKLSWTFIFSSVTYKIGIHFS